MTVDWVIVVDDNRNDQRMICDILRSAGIRTSSMRSGEDTLDYIRKGGIPDLILLDMDMPEADGFETMRLLKAEMDGENEVPIVLMTSEEDEEARGLEEGAMDIIRKPLESDVVISRVCKALDISRRMKRFARNAETDQMTDLLNKSATEARMERLCDEEQGLLCILDLDNFKNVNDTYGHDVGDKVIMMFARVLKMNLRRDDECGRIGGDEFAVFLKNMKTAADLDRYINRINQGYETGTRAIVGEKMKISVGVSAGAVQVPQCGREYTELFRMADQAERQARGEAVCIAAKQGVQTGKGNGPGDRDDDAAGADADSRSHVDREGNLQQHLSVHGAVYEPVQEQCLPGAADPEDRLGDA